MSGSAEAAAPSDVEKPEARQEQVVFETPDDISDEEPLRRTETPANEDIDTSASDFTDNYKKMRNLTFSTEPGDIYHGSPMVKESTVFNSHTDTAPPHEKAQRIRRELEDLEMKLRALVDAGGVDGDDLLAAVKAQDAADLQRNVRHMAEVLTALQLNPDFKPFVGEEAKSGTGGVSTALMQKIETFQKVSSKAKPSASTDGPGTSLTYELYCSKAHVDANVKHSVGRVEERIARLEQALGGAVSTSSHLQTPQPALLLRLEALEDSVGLLDSGKLKSVSDKMTQLTKEFDAFLRKCEKEAKGGRKFSSSAGKQKRLDTMFQTMQKWQDGAAALPKVVARLQSLRALHEESALFSRRLLALETSQNDLKAILEGDASALKAVQKTIAANTAIVKENIQAMDARLAKLESE